MRSAAQAPCTEGRELWLRHACPSSQPCRGARAAVSAGRACAWAGRAADGGVALPRRQASLTGESEPMRKDPHSGAFCKSGTEVRARVSDRRVA